MPPKRNSFQDRIEAFRSKCADADPVAVQLAVRKALCDRNYLLVKRAADLSGERLFYDLEEELLKAYQRFLKNPVKNDPGCVAKGAIVRALVALDSQEIDFFIAGLRYRQHEPVWGGSVDTAIDLRVNCAVGLINTSYSRALIELVTLLHDPETQARKGAVHAITCAQPFAAEAVLRAKALAGDAEPDVTANALVALLQIAPNESLDFVRGFLDDGKDPLLRESIAFALGESRIDEALDLLRASWDELLYIRKQDHVLLRGAIFHRSENAFAWMLDVVAEGDQASARFVIEELAIYHTNKKLRERLLAALAQRGDDVLTTRFRETWR